MAHRNADQERLLIKAFARGLKSNELARKLIEQSPATIEAAFVDVTRFCERQDAYTRLGRDEQPMEVGMMGKAASDSTPPLIKIDSGEAGHDNRQDRNAQPCLP